METDSFSLLATIRYRGSPEKHIYTYNIVGMGTFYTANCVLISEKYAGRVRKRKRDYFVQRVPLKEQDKYSIYKVSAKSNVEGDTSASYAILKVSSTILIERIILRYFLIEIYEDNSINIFRLFVT